MVVDGSGLVVVEELVVVSSSEVVVSWAVVDGDPVVVVTSTKGRGSAKSVGGRVFAPTRATIAPAAATAEVWALAAPMAANQASGARRSLSSGSPARNA